MSLRNKYNELYGEISQKFSELRGLRKEFVFIPDEDIEEGEFYYEYFEVRNDQTGGVFDVFISKVDGNGIHVIESSDTNKRQTIGLHELSGLFYMISLIELMEMHLKD